MDVKDLALDGLSELQSALVQAVDGLKDDELMWQPQPGANHIAFNLWHMLRVEDLFFQRLFQRVSQVWETERWHDKLDLPEDPRVNGYGYTAEQVDKFPRVQLRDLLAYGEAVQARALAYIQSLDPPGFDEIVKTHFFGDVSVAHMISHLLIEMAQHVGQMAYIRGLMKGQDEQS